MFCEILVILLLLRQIQISQQAGENDTDFEVTFIEIPVSFTASELVDEQKVAYFREDLGLNLFHWQWHVSYPTRKADGKIDRDRRGELFYYSHWQIYSRYNIERLCNNMKPVARFVDWNAPIIEAYFPKLYETLTSRRYASRPENLILSDIDRELAVTVNDIRTVRERIFAAINTNQAKHKNGSFVALTEMDGIDILGNIIESSELSPDLEYYGNIHNWGHELISYAHDPTGKYLEPSGVLHMFSTAMRDPMFYRWHGFIDTMFQKFKKLLPSYTKEQLDNPGVIVEDVQVISNATKNQLRTFWQKSEAFLARGLDFMIFNPVMARFTHLNHAEFHFKIEVKSNSSRNSTCRIFMAPKFDVSGNKLLFREQKHLFIELDKFVVMLKKGNNTIVRHSTESSLTIPFERTFRDMTNWPDENEGNNETNEKIAQWAHCGCGWPQHMLIPKGSSEGTIFKLFVMLSNTEDDEVKQEVSGECTDAPSLCGIKDKLYPDRRSMGYPFDRVSRQGVYTLNEFLTPNMKVVDVTILHENKVYNGSTLTDD